MQRFTSISLDSISNTNIHVVLSAGRWTRRGDWAPISKV